MFGRYKGYFINSLYNVSKREGDPTLYISNSRCWILKEWPKYKWRHLQSVGTMKHLINYELDRLSSEVDESVPLLNIEKTDLKGLKDQLREICDNIRGLKNLKAKLIALSDCISRMEDTDPMLGGSHHRLRLEAKN